jgi:streptogramin lyase
MCAIAAPSEAAPLRAGDIVVVDTHSRRIVRIEPGTGLREQIASWRGDAGLRLNFPWGIALEHPPRVLIADMNAHAIFAIDAATGDKTVLAGPRRAGEPSFYSLRGIALDGAGGAYVSNTQRRGRAAVHSILHVDLATGSRRDISSAAVGSGPALEFPSDLAIEPDGTLLVNIRTLGAVYRVDPRSGDRTVLSSTEVGSGPSLGHPYGIERLADGDVVVTDRSLGRIVRVDGRTGDRAILSSSEVGTGPPLKKPFGVAQAADGNLIVADLGNASVFHVELATGNRRVIAAPEVGTGPVLVMPRNLVIVPGGDRGGNPAPLLAAAIVAFVGGIALVILISRRHAAE